ncbi:spindle pole body formation-associated protein-domain-containing protein [Cryomyces antarcticus]
MLSWITGARPEGHQVVGADETGYIEPPETPAPVFAVRAFKHAIFGTPQPPEHNESKSRSREKSHVASGEYPDHGDLHGPAEKVSAQALVSLNTDAPITSIQEANPLASPTKTNGILMTPGTATTRRKTVSFGVHVIDNEGKKSNFVGKSGLPNNFPGKFPSPWTPKVIDMTATKSTDSKSRTKLTAALYEVRESTSKPKATSKTKDDADTTIDIMEPRSHSGQYWKQEYESYAEKTKHEMKKLVVKQKLAKHYAKEKDDEAMKLATELQKERRKIEKLEARTSDLAAQMKDYQERLRKAMSDVLASTTENSGLKRQVASLQAAAATKDGSCESAPTELQAQQRRTVRELREARDEASDLRLEKQQLVKDLEAAQAEVTLLKNRSKRKADKSRPTVDIWAQAVIPSPAPAEAQSGDVALSCTDSTKDATLSGSPLATRKTNGSLDNIPVQDRKQLVNITSSNIESLRRTLTSGKGNDITHPSIDRLTPRRNSTDSSLNLPRPSPELLASNHLRNGRHDFSESSVFTPDVLSSPPKMDALAMPISAAPLVSISRNKAPRVGAAVNQSAVSNMPRALPRKENNIAKPPTSNKENAAPATAAPVGQPDVSAKPPAVYEISTLGKRTASLMSGERRHIDPERAAAAKTRLEARRREKEMGVRS